MSGGVCSQVFIRPVGYTLRGGPGEPAAAGDPGYSMPTMVTILPPHDTFSDHTATTAKSKKQ